METPKTSLQKRAEEFLDKHPSAVERMPPRDVRSLIEELHLHQIELELQNEELRGAQEQIEAARQAFSDLYDFAPVGYFTVSDKGIVVRANLPGASMLGMERAELIGRPFSHFISKDFQDAYYFHSRQVSGTDDRLTCELILLRKEGSELYAELTTRRVPYSGANYELQTTVTDITERKLGEKQREDLQAQRHLARKYEAVAILAGGVAHQFNNALFAVAGSVELLEMGLPGHKDLAVYLERIRESTARMAGLTSQLLAYARGGKYRSTIISMRDFLRHALPFIQRGLPSFIHLEADVPGDAFNIKGDPLQLEMMLSAILFNASEAVEKEGLIRVSLMGGEASENFARDHPGMKPGRCVCLTVEDDGKGMDKETRRWVFEPFFTTKSEGRGLGMAAAFGIIKNHNGWVSVDSELGEGSVVRVYFPTIEAEKGEETRPLSHLYGDKDARAKDLEVHAYPILSNAGKPSEPMESSLGMIEGKQVEEALLKSSERMKLFAYSVAHDLKGPAVGVYGLTKRLQRQYEDVFDERAKGYCEGILGGAERILALAENINLYISTKEMPLNVESVELTEVVQTVRDEFSGRLDRRHINWSQPESLPEIRGDRLSILRALRNLVDNALKYGGEELSEIGIGYDVYDDFHLLSVSDDGVGMKKSEKVFEPFQRAETSMGVKGTGLGLAIVREVAQQHDGRAWMADRPEKGTTLYLSISRFL
jgi:two-component system cell cycle sensor histidine kinase/response regulator CckA